MFLIRLIFSIIFAPVRWIANLITKRKNNILEWHLNYGSLFVTVKTFHKEESLSDDLLIASYLLFLTRYFYICDERQVDIVRNFLFENIEKSEMLSKFTPELYEAVFQTLNDWEQDAAISLFKIYNKYSPIPPMTFSEDEEPKHSFAKYIFMVFERNNNNGLSNIFHMSAGPDIILLPITIGILYEYVISRFQDKSRNEKLNNCILDLLKMHSIIDCRTMVGLNELPNKVMRDNNIQW